MRGGAEAPTRKALQGYNLNFIDTAMVMMSSITIVAYLMYTVSEEVVERLGNEYVYCTTLFVILGILRYLQLALVFNRSESPTKLIWTDRFLQLIILMWSLSFAYLLYTR